MLGRQWMGAMLLGLALGGCGTDDPPIGVTGHVNAYFGGVAADEPQAALVGRDALSAGGTAADAVAAMAFALMVSRPDVAGLGGGGVCLYFDRATKKAVAIDFLPRAARAPPPPGQWIAAAPGGPRGLFALHARYGRLRWEQIVLPAERMARFGTAMPRGLARAIEAGRAHIDASADLKALLTGGDGKIPAESEMLRQLDLSIVLSSIRTAGPGPFHTALPAHQFVEGVRGAGGWLTIEDMRDYRPVWRETITAPYGNHVLHFAPSPAVGGRVVAALWDALGKDRKYAGAAPAERPHLVAAAADRAYGATLSRPTSEPSGAGLLAIDREGSGAACVLTMNRFFGSRRVAAGTGIVAVSPADGGATLGVASVLMVNHNVPQTFVAATGAGNGYAPVALSTVLLGVLATKQKLDEAMAAARPNLSAGAQRTPAPVNIMFCPDGVVDRPELCEARSDPRGFGYAITAEQ